MEPKVLFLPNGQIVDVVPVLGGLSFAVKGFQPGWIAILESQRGDLDEAGPEHPSTKFGRYKYPTLCSDTIFISSLINTQSDGPMPGPSLPEQISMMLWVTLSWYFHQPSPDRRILTELSAKTPEAGRPKGEWRVGIRKEGLFKEMNLLQELERVSLISSEDSCVGTEAGYESKNSWSEMFVSQRWFWQLDPHIFLTSGWHNAREDPPVSCVPLVPQPGTQSREGSTKPELFETQISDLWSKDCALGSQRHIHPHPPPMQYTSSNHVRHPLRPKPPRQGQTFYTRFVPSLDQYLSFRVVSLGAGSACVAPLSNSFGDSRFIDDTEPRPCASSSSDNSYNAKILRNAAKPVARTVGPAPTASIDESKCDVDLLNDWMNKPRISAAWGLSGPRETQEAFLTEGLRSRHSFPVIGCWDGVPFGYFEIYWVKEDQLGRHMPGSERADWDRGIHVLVGEERFRGPDRVKVWLSALVHYCWLSDPRTTRVMLEPRVDNRKLIDYLQQLGFYKNGEIAFPHKQAALMQINRDSWEAPIV